MKKASGRFVLFDGNPAFCNLCMRSVNFIIDRRIPAARLFNLPPHHARASSSSELSGIIVPALPDHVYPLHRQHGLLRSPRCLFANRSAIFTTLDAGALRLCHRHSRPPLFGSATTAYDFIARKSNIDVWGIIDSVPDAFTGKIPLRRFVSIPSRFVPLKTYREPEDPPSIDIILAISGPRRDDRFVPCVTVK